MSNEFLPFGTGGGANVIDQATYAALAARSTGFQAGVAKSNELNKTWRQSAFMAAMLGQFIDTRSTGDALDNGDLNAMVQLFEEALRAINAGTLRTVVLTAASGTWVAPADVSVVNRVIGIGGGGSGGNSNTTNSRASGGGGGGAFERFNVPVTPGGSYPWTRGAGGAVNGSGAGFSGNAGGSTAMFGTTATGGAGGNGANNNVYAVQVGAGSVTGTPANISYQGGIGTEGSVGTGGGSIWAQPTQRAFTNAGNNNSANGPGGGGPGGSDFAGAWQPGGAGANGIILLQYFSRFA